MKRLRKICGTVLIAFCALIGVLFLCHLALRPNPNQADVEQYLVLSAYMAPVLTGESHDLGSRSETLVIYGSPTFSSQMIDISRFKQYVMLLSRTHQARTTIQQLGRPVLFEFYAVNLSSETFEKKFRLPARYELATPEEIRMYPSEQFGRRFPSNYGFLTFSRIGFNHDLTEAFFYTEHICGLCGEGKFVFMRKVRGNWVVETTSSTWIS